MVLAEVAEPAGARELGGPLFEHAQILAPHKLDHQVRGHEVIGIRAFQLLQAQGVN